MKKAPASVGKRDVSRRLSDVPMNNFGWNAFFEERVQNILKRRKIPPKFDDPFDKQEIDALLAWPILAFERLNQFVVNSGVSQSNMGDVSWEYQEDPVFVAALLSELTSYHYLPESQWSSVRMVLEYSGQMNSKLAASFSFATPKEERNSEAANKGSELESVAGIFAAVSFRFASCRNKPMRAQNVQHLLKYLKHSRNKILSTWEPNFAAWQRINLKDFHLPVRFDVRG